MRDIIIFIILLLIFLLSLYLLSPYINFSREDFTTGRFLKDLYFSDKITPDFLQNYDTSLNYNNGIDDYTSNFMLLFKRCYNFPAMYAEMLLTPYELHDSTSIFNFKDLISNTNAENLSNLCIHKYVKYTNTVNDIISSIKNDVQNFHDCKILLNKNNNPEIIGNVYLLMAQIPYMIDNKGNTISTKFDSESLGYTSYLDQNSNPSNPITTGKIIYIYYLIYDCYDSNYNQLTVENNKGKFEKYVLPNLDKYASNDESCLSKCSQDDPSGYLCGCISTIPLTTNGKIYNSNNPGDLDLSINAVGSSYKSLLDLVKTNNIYSDQINKLENLSDPDTCKSSLNSSKLSDSDVADLKGGYAGRCVNNTTSSATITNYMTLYKINQNVFKTSGEQLFASQNNLRG